MELTAAEGRVLGCLVERQVAEPEAESSLDDVRFACNQAAHDTVTYDDRTVQQALLSLKSKGLARFVAAGHTVGPVSYRHRVDQRWRMSVPEMAVLARLLLGGPQTADEVRADLHHLHDVVDNGSVEAALDALAGRTPTPFAIRISPDKWEGNDTLWAEVLTGEPSFEELHRIARRLQTRPPSPRSDAPRQGQPASTATAPGPRPAPTLADLADRLTKIERRLAGIEAALTALRSGSHESSRVIR